MALLTGLTRSAALAGAIVLGLAWWDVDVVASVRAATGRLVGPVLSQVAAHGWYATATSHATATYITALFALFAVVSFVATLANHVPVVRSDLKPTFPPGPPRRVNALQLRLPDRPNVIQCYDPSTLRFLGEIPVTTPDQVRAAVERGRTAQRHWSMSTFETRRRVLRMMRAAILAQQDDIVRLSCLDTGKPRVDAQFGEILSSLGKLTWVIDNGESVLSPETRGTNFTSIHKRAEVTYSPLGVIGVIAPWNYPFYNLYNHIASALFAGNAVVCKISEYSAWSGQHFIRIAQDVLAASGQDRNLVQLVQGFGDTGATLVNTADKIIFTGSPGVGKAVMRGASDTLTPLVLELGGKDPFIICNDANVMSALSLAMRGTFQNAGQNCVGIERIYVYSSIYEQFVQAAAAAVSSLRVGPPTLLNGNYSSADLGCITTYPQLSLIQELVDDAVSKGAKLVVGGHMLFNPKVLANHKSDAYAPTETGLFYAPTLLVDVTHEMRIANEEVFGPVMTVFRVPNDSDDAAVAMANSTMYGLGATVFSASPARANVIAARLKCGMVGVNAFGLNYLVQSLPFGGVGASGFDRFSGPEGLRACCLVKSVVTDLASAFSIPTPVPRPLQYPLSSTAPYFTKALIDLQFAPSIFRRMAALFKLAMPTVPTNPEAQA